MKKKVIIPLVILLIVIAVFVGVRSLTSHKNEQIILNEVTDAIETNLQSVYSSNDAQEYGIDNIQFEISRIEKTKQRYDADYSFAVTFSCDANSNLDYLEKSLAAYAIEESVDIFSDGKYKTSNGLTVTDRNDSFYEQVDVYINGELVHKNGEKISSSTTTNNKPSDDKMRDAWNCATDVVKNELYHYSSIKVSSYKDSTVTYTESTDIYTIKGTVSYKNEYNATVNYKFTAQLKLTEHGYSDSSVLFY